MRDDRVLEVLAGSSAFEADEGVDGCAEPLEYFDQDLVAGGMPHGAVEGEIFLADGEVVVVGYLLLHAVEVAFEPEAAGIRIRCMARTTAQTGVEMEALTGVAAAALTIYDMCKAIDKAMTIGEITLLSKTKS